MNALFRLAAAGAIAAGSLLAPAQAALITVNQTLDVTQPESTAGPGFQGWQGTPAFNGGYNVAIAEGDTFDYTIDFLGSQTLTLLNLSQVWAFSYADVVGDVTGTGTFSFLDSAGNPFLTSNSKTDTEGMIHFGQFFSSGDFAGGLPTSITFSGVRYTGTLDDYVNPGQTTKNYANPAFYFTADNVPGTVPEPASWALMIAGFGLTGAAMRRRRVAIVIA